MKLSCSQMDILLSFYLEDEISPALKKAVETHLSECKTCFEKYRMVHELFDDMKCGFIEDFTNSEPEFTNVHSNEFSTKISSYIDNELTDEENIKVKKLAIMNKKVRKELEDSYNIRRLMSDSFKKSKSDAKEDYVKSVLRKLELDEEISANFHPAVRFLVIFTMSALVLATLVFVSINFA